jgi:hypothetical protein
VTSALGFPNIFGTQNNAFVVLVQSVRVHPVQNPTGCKAETVDLLTYCPHVDAVLVHFICVVPTISHESFELVSW